VANMPGAVPRTSTQALANAVFPYVLKIARDGLEKAAAKDPALAKGINVYACPGKPGAVLTNQAVAKACGEKYLPLERAVKKS